MHTGPIIRWILTLCMLCVAGLFIYTRYTAYFINPWTRDGMVQADVVDLACRIPGQVKAVYVQDNAFVRAGTPVFDLETTDLQNALDRAQAAVRQKEALLSAATLTAQENTRLREESPGAISNQTWQLSEDARLAAEAALALAHADLKQAEANLGYAHVKAPADGFIVNVNLQPGKMLSAYTPAMALILADSFRVDAFFRETLIGHFAPGDEAAVTLMTYPDRPLRARLESVGRGIARQDGSTGENLLPTVSPTFEWIRLAQRIPVRVRLLDVPKDIQLRVGMTASVLIRDQTASREPLLPLPAWLQ